MAQGSSGSAGDVGVARTGSRITRAMQESAAHRETSGPRPEQQRCAQSPVLVLSLRMRQSASGRPYALSHSGNAAWSVETCACSPDQQS
jgi:hypothetical protein